MANEAKQFTIGGVTHDVMDVGARQLIAQLQAAIDAITSGDTTTAIKTFQEVIDFLDGVTDDATLIGKLNELRTLINAKYSKPASGIPASDLANGVIPDVSGFATKTEVNAKANDADVVKGIRAYGSSTNLHKSNDGIVTLPEIQGGLTKEDISVETQGDGTVDINIKDDTYTINLNHTHENMAKLEIVDEEPSDPALDTIYALVDDATDPTEIQSLWIAGLEFVGGGGGEPDYTPKLISPRPGATIDFDGQSTATLVVKGRNLASNLSVVATGDFTVTANGQSVSTIAAADVTDGASLTLTLTKGSNFVGGTIVISSQDLDEDVRLSISDSSAVVALTGVKFTGTQWLQANYYPNPKTEFLLDMELASNENTDDNLDPPEGPCPYILSCENEGNNRFSFLTRATGTYSNNLSCYNDVVSTRTNIKYDTIAGLLGRSVMSYRKNTSDMTLSFRGKSVTLALKSNTMESKLAIGYSYYYNKAFDVFDMTVYGFKIIEDGVVIRDYVPMRRYGVPGLFDTKTGEFITSKTNDPLVEVNS